MSTSTPARSPASRPPRAASAGLLRSFYSSLYVVLAPLIALLLSTRRDSRRRWTEYLAYPPPSPPDAHGRLWVHAVSVGETLSAWPVVAELVARTGLAPYLTSTIEDAIELARRQSPPPEGCRFLPLDLLSFQQRLL